MNIQHFSFSVWYSHPHIFIKKLHYNFIYSTLHRHIAHIVIRIKPTKPPRKQTGASHISHISLRARLHYYLFVIPRTGALLLQLTARAAAPEEHYSRVIGRRSYIRAQSPAARALQLSHRAQAENHGRLKLSQGGKPLARVCKSCEKELRDYIYISVEEGGTSVGWQRALGTGE